MCIYVYIQKFHVDFVAQSSKYSPIMDGKSISNIYVSLNCDETVLSELMKDTEKPGAVVDPRQI